MKLSSSDLIMLSEVASNAALKAGVVIREKFNTSLDITYKDVGSTLAAQVLTEVDAEAQDIILKELENITQEFDLGILSEEQVDDKSRFKKDYFWCIDPLDGTLAFTKAVAGGSCVSIALVSKQGIPYVGVVYEPMSDKLYCAIKGMGVKLNNKTIKLNVDKKLKATAIDIICTEDFLEHPQYYMTIEKLSRHVGSEDNVNTKVVVAGAVSLACQVLETSLGKISTEPNVIRNSVEVSKEKFGDSAKLMPNKTITNADVKLMPDETTADTGAKVESIEARDEQKSATANIWGKAVKKVEAKKRIITAERIKYDSEESEKLTLVEKKEKIKPIIAENRLAVLVKYPKPQEGGGALWDYAATACIFKELRLHCSDFFCNPINFNNKKSLFLNRMGVVYSTNSSVANKLSRKV